MKLENIGEGFEKVGDLSRGMYIRSIGDMSKLYKMPDTIKKKWKT